MSRKDISIAPNTKMKQLQWDKLAQQQVGKTLWGVEETDREREWIKKLKEQRIWEEMEEDFKAKQLVMILMGKVSLLCGLFTWLTSNLGKQKKAELRSVLDTDTKKRVGSYFLAFCNFLVLIFA